MLFLKHLNLKNKFAEKKFYKRNHEILAILNKRLSFLFSLTATCAELRRSKRSFLHTFGFL